MALTQVSLGATANDGTGSSLRAAGALINTAFAAIDGLARTSVFYVTKTGNNATAEPGNPSRPYLTEQAAFNAWVTSNAPGALVFGVGTWTGGITVAADMAHRLGLYGFGRGVSVIGDITANGSTPSTAPSGESGATGGASKALKLVSDGSVSIGAISSVGGTGGAGGPGNEETTSTNGGTGGESAACVLLGVRCASVDIYGGVGGNGQDGGNVGADGGAGNVAMHGCSVAGGVALGREANPTGTIKISGCSIGAPLSAYATAGYAANTFASSVALGASLTNNVVATNLVEDPES